MESKIRLLLDLRITGGLLWHSAREQQRKLFKGSIQ